MHVQYEKEIYSPSRGEDYILYSTVVSPPVGSYSGLCTVQYTLQRSLFLETHILDSALYSVQWSLFLEAHILDSGQYSGLFSWGLIFWNLTICTVHGLFSSGAHILDSVLYNCLSFSFSYSGLWRKYIPVLRSRSRWSRNSLRPGAGAEMIFLINIYRIQFGGC